MLFHFSLLVVEAADRPGLLVDLVRIISDINITVQSGEFDTEVTLIIRSLCPCKEPFMS
jgi:UTP:GlnB (protein PII) uridylyltransferase